ncbi:hypothetical protein GCK32_007540 [Trichostrongylus colubriformis]|uniref:Uncharacterized protein n=1 Tax=Trichostrongylus colubriformis TaxID=6319 RepID=A0AAN8EQ09_TRICO
MGDQGVELKESPPPVNSSPPPEAEKSDSAPTAPAETAPARLARADLMPRIGGRRVSSIEAVKGAPPPKRQSMVVFETPDSPPPHRSLSWWRNLVMDDDKALAKAPPEAVPEKINGLEEHNRNVSSASVGDKWAERGERWDERPQVP